MSGVQIGQCQEVYLDIGQHKEVYVQKTNFYACAMTPDLSTQSVEA